MLLLLDNYDSFTYNLKDYFEQLGQEVLVLRNDQTTLAEIDELHVDGIVISPGPQRPDDAGICMELLQYYQNNKPILGVCLGHQAIGLAYGATLVKAPKPMHGKVSRIRPVGHKMFEGIDDDFDVCRYHSLVLDEIPGALEILARSEDQCVMAIAHKERPIWGVQFHPEAILSEHGLLILSNWLKLL